LSAWCQSNRFFFHATVSHSSSSSSSSIAAPLDHPVIGEMDILHMADPLVDRGRTPLEVQKQRVREQANIRCKGPKLFSLSLFLAGTSLISHLQACKTTQMALWHLRCWWRVVIGHGGVVCYIIIPSAWNFLFFNYKIHALQRVVQHLMKIKSP